MRLCSSSLLQGSRSGSRSSRQPRGLITLSGALWLTSSSCFRLTWLCFNTRWSRGLMGKGQSPLHRGLTPPIICDSAQTDMLRDETLLFNFKPLLFHNSKSSPHAGILLLPLSSRWRDCGRVAVVMKPFILKELLSPNAVSFACQSVIQRSHGVYVWWIERPEHQRLTNINWERPHWTEFSCHYLLKMDVFLWNGIEFHIQIRI